MPPPHWHPKALLSLYPAQPSFTCLGKVGREGRRCGKAIRLPERSEASSLLDQLGLSPLSSPDLEQRLRDIATLTLCAQFHRTLAHSQIDEVVRGWIVKVEEEKARVERERVAREQEIQELERYREMVRDVEIHRAGVRGQADELHDVQRRYGDPIAPAGPPRDAEVVANGDGLGQADIDLQQAQPAARHQPVNQRRLRRASIREPEAHPGGNVDDMHLQDHLGAPAVHRHHNHDNAHAQDDGHHQHEDQFNPPQLQAFQVPGQADIQRVQNIENAVGREIDEADVLFGRQLEVIEARMAEIRAERARADEAIRAPLAAQRQEALPAGQPLRQRARAPNAAPQDQVQAPARQRGQPPAPAAQPGIHQPPAQGRHHVIRKPIIQDCPICLERIEHIDDAEWCRGTCGQNMHKQCFRTWVDTRFGAGTYDRKGQLNGREVFAVTCACCRGRWLWD